MYSLDLANNIITFVDETFDLVDYTTSRVVYLFLCVFSCFRVRLGYERVIECPL